MSDPVHPRVENIVPILRVEDMSAALHFYVDLLGFTNAPWGSNDFTQVSRDGSCIYLSLPPTTFPWALEMQIEDPDGNVLRIGSDPK